MSKKLLRNDIDAMKTISGKNVVLGPKFSKWNQKMQKKPKFLEIIIKASRIDSMRFRHHLIYV